MLSDRAQIPGLPAPSCWGRDVIRPLTGGASESLFGGPAVEPAVSVMRLWRPQILVILVAVRNGWNDNGAGCHDSRD